LKKCLTKLEHFQSACLGIKAQGLALVILFFSEKNQASLSKSGWKTWRIAIYDKFH